MNIWIFINNFHFPFLKSHLLDLMEDLDHGRSVNKFSAFTKIEVHGEDALLKFGNNTAKMTRDELGDYLFEKYMEV